MTAGSERTTSLLLLRWRSPAAARTILSVTTGQVTMGKVTMGKVTMG